MLRLDGVGASHEFRTAAGLVCYLAPREPPNHSLGPCFQRCCHRGCASRPDLDVAESEAAYSQAAVDADPTLKALQVAAANVNQYEINVADIAVPVPNASVGTQINGFSTRGLDWFKNPTVIYPDNKVHCGR